MKKNKLFLGNFLFLFICLILTQSCIKPISAELPPPPPTFKAKLNGANWVANAPATAVVLNDTISGCAILTLGALKVVDVNNPQTLEQITLILSFFNAFSGTDLCIPVGSYFELNNSGNPTIGCTGGGNNGRIYSTGNYSIGTTSVNNGTNICTVKITSCKNNTISGSFSFKGVDASVTPAKTYNITGGIFTDVPITKGN